MILSNQIEPRMIKRSDEQSEILFEVTVIKRLFGSTRTPLLTLFQKYYSFETNLKCPRDTNYR